MILLDVTWPEMDGSEPVIQSHQPSKGRRGWPRLALLGLMAVWLNVTLHAELAAGPVARVAPQLGGSVRGANNEPRRGVKVEAVRAADGTVAAQTLSDARGGFALRNLPDGSYQLRAAAPGGPVSLDIGAAVEVGAGKISTNLLLRLPAVDGTPPTGPNRVLELDGVPGSVVQLPTNIFNSLAESTVECWVRWDSLTNRSSFFRSGETNRELALDSEDGDLSFSVQPGTPVLVRADGVLRTNEWCHVAAVSGPRGLRLYLNGVLLASRPEKFSFDSLGAGGFNTLGANLHGVMDELRVWATERTPEEIRAGMFRRLSGNEDGLAGLWNFDNPAEPARDATPNQFHGRFYGDLQIAPGEVPSSLERVSQWANLSVSVTDVDGRALRDVNIRLTGAETEALEGRTDAAGNFFVALRLPGEPLRLTASHRELSSMPTNVVFHEGAQSVNLIVRDVTPLSGLVLAPDDSPLPTVVVQAVPVLLENQMPEPNGAARLTLTTMTDAKGRYQFSEVPPGSYTLRAHVSGGFVEFDNGRAVTFDRDNTVAQCDFRLRPFKKGRWKNYSHLDGLVDDSVTCVFEAADGAMWFGASDGASRFDGRKFSNLTRRKELPDGKVTAISQTADGTMWFGTTEGLGQFDPRRGHFATFTTSQGLPANAITALARAHGGRLWIGTKAGLAYYDPGDAEKPVFVSARTNYATLFAGEVTSLHVDGRGVVLIGHTNGVSMIFSSADVSSSGVTGLGALAGRTVLAFFESSEGALWIGTAQDGVFRFTPKTPTNALTQLRAQDGLVENRVTGIAQAEGGAMWFATARTSQSALPGGLSRYDGKSFVNFTPADGLAIKTILGVHFDAHGGLWAATPAGVIHYDGQSMIRFDERDGLDAGTVADIASRATAACGSRSARWPESFRASTASVSRRSRGRTGCKARASVACSWTATARCSSAACARPSRSSCRRPGPASVRASRRWKTPARSRRSRAPRRDSFGRARENFRSRARPREKASASGGCCRRPRTARSGS